MERFCGILGARCSKFRLKCLFFWPWNFPREAQDEVLKGAIFKILECLQTILFTTLEPSQKSLRTGLRRVCGAVSEGFFVELRRSSVLNANVGAVSRRTCVAMGVPWALLGSTWTLSWATAWPKCLFFLNIFFDFCSHELRL